MNYLNKNARLIFFKQAFFILKISFYTNSSLRPLEFNTIYSFLLMLITPS